VGVTLSCHLDVTVNGRHAYWIVTFAPTSDPGDLCRRIAAKLPLVGALCTRSCRCHRQHGSGDLVVFGAAAYATPISTTRLRHEAHWTDWFLSIGVSFLSLESILPRVGVAGASRGIRRSDKPLTVTFRLKAEEKPVHARPFYITRPIYYVRPAHIAHIYTTVVADTIARTSGCGA